MTVWTVAVLSVQWSAAGRASDYVSDQALDNYSFL